MYIYEACQPIRKANIDSAVLPLPLERVVNASTDTYNNYDSLRYNRKSGGTHYLLQAMEMMSDLPGE